MSSIFFCASIPLHNLQVAFGQLLPQCAAKIPLIQVEKRYPGFLLAGEFHDIFLHRGNHHHQDGGHEKQHQQTCRGRAAAAEVPWRLRLIISA